jgi:hypothetical protein
MPHLPRPRRRAQVARLGLAPSGLAQCLKSSQEVRSLGQDLKTSFRKAVRPHVPFSYYVDRYMLALFPNAVPLIFGQGNDYGALF